MLFQHSALSPSPAFCSHSCYMHPPRALPSTGRYSRCTEPRGVQYKFKRDIRMTTYTGQLSDIKNGFRIKFKFKSQLNNVQTKQTHLCSFFLGHPGQMRTANLSTIKGCSCTWAGALGQSYFPTLPDNKIYWNATYILSKGKRWPIILYWKEHLLPPKPKTCNTDRLLLVKHKFLQWRFSWLLSL